MQVSVIANPRSSHQVAHQKAMIIGLGKIGIKGIPVSSEINVRTKYVACWGWKIGKRLRERGLEVLVMERGYIGDRFKYTSLGWNGLNGHATFPEYPDDEGKRFLSHGGMIKPWKEGGDYIVIMGQVKNDASLDGKDILLWYKEQAKTAESYGVPIFFRPHPEARRRGGYSSVPGIPNIEGDLHDVLDGALLTIAYNSNSCVDSILNGVPCFAGNKGTMAFKMCNGLKVDRKEAHSIAWKQWELHEIESGFALYGLFTNAMCSHSVRQKPQ